jgi:uncharacterized protein involved in exopolysaccharide biosynthesis
MGWDKRGYYYRARKVNGRVMREYVGAGPVATLSAELDELERQERAERRAVEKAEREAIEALDKPVAELNELVEQVARAALLAAGYHQHKRAEWRKRHDRNEEPARPTKSA